MHRILIFFFKLWQNARKQRASIPGTSQGAAQWWSVLSVVQLPHPHLPQPPRPHLQNFLILQN